MGGVGEDELQHTSNSQLETPGSCGSLSCRASGPFAITNHHEHDLGPSPAP